MLTINEIKCDGYEKVIEISDPSVGLNAFIAIHSTALGPSLGGVRMFPYQTKDEALADALKLSKAMSYKSALAETGLGGGKCVVIADPKKQKTKELLLSLADAIHSLNGQYIAAEDMGMTPEDIAIIGTKTPHICAVITENSSGDPSRFTAFGVLSGIRATLKELYGTTSCEGRTIAIQGLGNVGAKLADYLFWENANLIVADINEEATKSAILNFGAKVVTPESIPYVPCDIFSPCARGGILNAMSISRLKCKGIAGAANNQLATREDGLLLKKTGILYAPDYIINAGGIINVSCEFTKEGYSAKTAYKKTAAIYDTLLEVYERSKNENKPTDVIADEIADYKLENKVGLRKESICR